MGFAYPAATRQRIAVFFLGLTIADLAAPAASYALTSGPSQPEFSSFEPVSTNQMVDEFSGDFTYNIPVINIPGPQGSDYPLSLSYHSGATPEEEASWVGYGWTLNPGAINRNTRGFPDDFNNVPVTYWNKTPTNWTVTAGAGLGVEILSKDAAKVDFGLRYNNYQGFGYNAGVGITLGKGVVSLGYNVVDGNGSFSAGLNPAALISEPAESHKAADKRDTPTHVDQPSDKKKPGKYTGNRVSLMGGSHGLFTYSEANRSAHAANYTGGAINVSTGFEWNPAPFPAGATVNVFGSYAWQKNVEQDRLGAYGYMYSSEASNSTATSKEAVRDYFTEKETPYNKRDVFLGIPFNNADVFSVSGEGVGGGFRLYHEEVGEFAPNTKTSETGIANIAPEFSAGMAFGAGTDFGAGWQRLSEGPWGSPEGFSEPNKGNDGVFFRFANDLGGQSAALGVVPDEPIAAQLTSNRGLDKARLKTQLHAAAAHGRASYIGYHTVGDLLNRNSGSVRRRARQFSQRDDLPVNNYTGLDESAICEMAVTTANGGRYIYGLPVLSKNEGNLQYSVKGETLNNNYSVSTTKPDQALAVKVGEVRAAAYANSFPLTEIRTPDYVDRTLDGPTADDLGGYTRFNYTKAYGGGTSGWYNWRVPYNGLLYQVNSLSDKDDDMGTVSYGQKEVAYLQSVQTKTHTAIFRTESRDDSKDAGSEETQGSGSPRARTGAENPTASNYKSLQKLVQIDLYANSDVVTANGVATARPGALPIKSVHFSYSYDLSKATTSAEEGLPNAIKDASNVRKGKLTLTKIWFEYQGIPTAVSPYTFSYAYPNYATYPTRYRPDEAQSVTKVLTDGLFTRLASYKYYDQLPASAQNPVYNAFCLDAWGNYRANGPGRAANLQPWLDQRDEEDLPAAEKNTWDPAAWQLKVITLPTGGQIHVQYEQDDYAFVQNKPVHAMVNLTSASNGGSVRGNKYYLDLTSLGLTTAEERTATVDALREQYLAGNNRKIFFKFLYNFTDDLVPTLQPLTRNTEYITGYASVQAVAEDASGVYIELDNSQNKYTLPHQVCKNFLQTQRAGKLGGDPFNAEPNGAVRAVRDLLAWGKAVVGVNTQCVKINWGLSYFRIPLVKPKKGGGLRVKRLLTFDKTGLDGSAVLYGSEYLYRMRDARGRVISSGVATTEPAGMREENILVDYLPRSGQSLGSKIISGIDRKQTEGPLGESLLPAPSVGYSRVVVRNIHSGRTTTGFSVSEYATARDYPMQVKYTALQSATQFRLQYALLATNQVNNTYATQGYSFILNNMHGQVLRKATYPGDYPGPTATQLPSPTNEQKFTYYEPARVTAQQTIVPGDFIPVATDRGAPIAVTPVANRIYPGREVDMTAAHKAVKDNMVDLNFETDVTVGLFFFPTFYAAVFPTLTRSEAELYTHVTSKVVRYPAVLKRVESLQDGIVHTTENIAFDRFSGQAVQTTSTDEFKGGYVQETVQAAWVNPEFGPKWQREDWTLDLQQSPAKLSVEANNEVWLKPAQATASACGWLSAISRGDHLVIDIQGNNGDNVLYFADAPDYLNNRVRVYPVSLPLSNPQSTTLPSGLPTSGDVAVNSVRVTVSGRKNQLTAAAGSTSYHGTDYTQLAAIGPYTTANQYGPIPLTTTINNWLSNNASQVTSNLPNSTATYSHVNITAYANKLPVGCVKDPSDVTISDVVMTRQTINGRVKISLVSFKVACDGGGSSVVNN